MAENLQEIKLKKKSNKAEISKKLDDENHNTEKPSKKEILTDKTL